MMGRPIQRVWAASTIAIRTAPTMRSRTGTFRASRCPWLGSRAVGSELSHDLAHRIAEPLGGKPVSSLRHLTTQFMLQSRVLNDPRDSFSGIVDGVKSQPGVASDNLYLATGIVHE